VYKFVRSYLSFHRNQKFYKTAIGYLRFKAPSPEVILSSACAMMVCQRYADAYKVYEEYLSRYSSNADKTVLEYVKENMKACTKPHPFTSGPKNYNDSYIHFKLMDYFGTRRYDLIFLKPEEVSFIERQMKSN